jgi:hypothetical protein
MPCAKGTRIRRNDTCKKSEEIISAIVRSGKIKKNLKM